MSIENQFVPSLDSMSHYIERSFCGIKESQILDYAILNKLNILTFGHAGVGKTSSNTWYASIRGWNYINIPSNDSMSAPDLQGNTIFNHETKEWEWHDSPLVQALRTGNAIIDIGEVIHLAKNVKNFLLPLLDYRREITLTAHKGEVIKAHPDVLLTANYNPNYRGSQPLPEMLADRFEIKLNYNYDRSIESQYVKSSSLLDLAFGIRSTSIGATPTSSSSSVFETPVTSRMLKTFEKVSKELSYDLACDIFTNNFTEEERPAVAMLLEGASYNIKDDLNKSTCVV